jgi:hypothetical protein
MADDAPPEASALFLEALPVLLANAVAMRAVGERTGVLVPRRGGGLVLPRVDRDALPDDVAHALTNVAAAGDAARARAMLACVCRDAQGAADAAFPAWQRHGDAARAVTCNEIAAALQHRSTVLLAHVAPVLQRLCAAAVPPLEPADAAGVLPSSARDAWQQLWRRVQTATDSWHELSARCASIIRAWYGQDFNAPWQLMEDFDAATTLLPLIGATKADVDAALAELRTAEDVWI